MQRRVPPNSISSLPSWKLSRAHWFTLLTWDRRSFFASWECESGFRYYLGLIQNMFLHTHLEQIDISCYSSLWTQDVQRCCQVIVKRLLGNSALDKERSLARDRKWPFTQWGPSCMKMLHCSVMSTEWFHYALRTKCTSVMHEREHGFRERDSGNWLHWWGKLFIVPSRIERAQALWDENWWTTFGSVTQMCHHIEVENNQETDNIWDAPQNQRSESPLPLQFWSSTYTLWLALWFDSHKR